MKKIFKRIDWFSAVLIWTLLMLSIGALVWLYMGYVWLMIPPYRAIFVLIALLSTPLAILFLIVSINEFIQEIKSCLK